MCIRDRYRRTAQFPIRRANCSGRLLFDYFCELHQRPPEQFVGRSRLCVSLVPLGNICRASIAPVSYTHLDVYKRQVPSSATAISDDQNQYYVVVTNAYGQAVSQPATLAVGSGILITQQPVTQYVDCLLYTSRCV